MKPGGAAGSASSGGEHYRFDRIVVDVPAHTLSRDGQPHALEPKAFAVLITLLRRPGELLGRDELLDEVWGHRHVTPGVLTRAIAQLRSALEDDVQQPRYIQTQHALGYRFIGELEPEEAVPAIAPANADEPMQVTITAGSAPSADAVAGIDGIASAVAISSGVPAPALPYAGSERRGAHRLWHWQWLFFGMLMLGLVAWAWVERRPASGRALEPSIAVLPFTNLSNDRGNDYFAEGLAVEMHDALAGVPGLKVAAQVSPSMVLEQGGDVKALGTLLGVATLLDANVRRDGQRVRINARLSDCATGYTLWSHSYDRQLADVFDTQVQIADEAVRSLVDVLPQQREAIARRLTPTRNAAAFDAYLRGLKQLLEKGPGDGTRDAIGFFNEALSVDRKFSRAQAGICRAEVASFIDRQDADAFARAQAACERAREMDPSLAEVNLAQAELHHADGEYGKAVEYFARAESDPASRPAAYVGIAIMQAEQGREAQALDYFNRALALRPGDARIHANIGYQHFLAGKLPEAITSYRKAVELNPGNVDLWSYLGGVYLTAGNVQEAERALSRSIAIKPSYAALTNLGEIKYMSGHYAEAVELQRRAVQLDPSDHLTWGNLGQAQLADPATASQAPASFREAANRAQRYVEIKTDDARAVAALGWYRASLGQPELARELVVRSEALGGEPGEVALYNAQTFVKLGEFDQARKRIAAARAAGIVESRIAGNAALRGVIAVAGSVDPDKTQETTPSTSNGSTRGE
ncbi:MAG: winged helix-turn-helix domain-containing tetratricopeptide repeat protein [Pseudoxanthomonas sp.]